MKTKNIYLVESFSVKLVSFLIPL